MTKPPAARSSLLARLERQLIFDFRVCLLVFFCVLHNRQEEEGKKDNAQEGKEEKDGAQEEDDDGSSPIVVEPTCSEIKAQLLHDVKTRGVWPICADKGGCPVLEGTGGCRWREYEWATQKFVDRRGVLQEKKIQVFQDRTGTRQR